MIDELAEGVRFWSREDVSCSWYCEVFAIAQVVLLRGRDRRIKEGHPWVYQGEVDSVVGDYQPGDAVDVVDFRRRFIARGFINPASQILVRVLTRAAEPIDGAFFYGRISQAVDYRRLVVTATDSYRLVYGEGDKLPGLIVDKFGDYLVMQTLTLGMDQRKRLIADVLVELLHPAGIFERNDASTRSLEGMDQVKGVLRGECPAEVVISENGFKFAVDIVGGQKTGYFLDQRENRAALRPYVSSARVLDAFCHTGSFAVHAAGYGAREVTGLDVSEDALAVARRNAEMNGYGAVCSFRSGNAFDLLREAQRNGEEYDVVILDPPAFTKSKKTVENAVRGYKEINLRGLQLLRKGGFLVTCSCSHHMSEELFLEVIRSAAIDLGATLRIVEVRTQARDHPEVMGVAETRYLKCIILQLI